MVCRVPSFPFGLSFEVHLCGVNGNILDDFLVSCRSFSTRCCFGAVKFRRRVRSDLHMYRERGETL